MFKGQRHFEVWKVWACLYRVWECTEYPQLKMGAKSPVRLVWGLDRATKYATELQHRLDHPAPPPAALFSTKKVDLDDLQR